MIRLPSPKDPDLPPEAAEWAGAWPFAGPGDGDNHEDTGPQSPLEALASNMMQTIAHVRAFPELAEALRDQVREVESMLEIAKQATTLTIVDWRPDAVAAAGGATQNRNPSDSEASVISSLLKGGYTASAGDRLSSRLLFDRDIDSHDKLFPKGLRVEVQAVRGKLHSWYDLDVLVVLMDATQAVEGVHATAQALGLEDSVSGGAPGGPETGSDGDASSQIHTRAELADELAERFPDRGLDALAAVAAVGQREGIDAVTNDLANLSHLSDTEVEERFLASAAAAAARMAVTCGAGEAVTRGRDPSDVASTPEKILRRAAQQVGPAAVFAAVECTRALKDDTDVNAAAGLAARAGIDDKQVVLIGGVLPFSPACDPPSKPPLLPSSRPASTSSSSSMSVVAGCDAGTQPVPEAVVRSESAFALDDEDDEYEALSMPAAKMESVSTSEASDSGGGSGAGSDAEDTAPGGLSLPAMSAEGDEAKMLAAWRQRLLAAVRTAALRKMGRMAVEYVPLRRTIMECLRNPSSCEASATAAFPHVSKPSLPVTRTPTMKAADTGHGGEAPWWEQQFGSEYERKAAAGELPPPPSKAPTKPLLAPRNFLTPSAKERAKHAGKEVLKFLDWVTNDRSDRPAGMGADGLILPGPGRAALDDAVAAEVDPAAVATHRRAEAQAQAEHLQKQEEHWRKMRQEQWRRQGEERNSAAAARAATAEVRVSEGAAGLEPLMARLAAAEFRAERAETASDVAEKRIADLELERLDILRTNAELREALLAIDPFHPLGLEACDE